MGIEQNRGLGLGHHQLCMVGRYRSRWYSNLRRIVTLPPEMENGHQPLCRSDDYLLSSTGGSLPYYPHGTPLVGVLDSAYTKPIRFALGEL